MSVRFVRLTADLLAWALLDDPDPSVRAIADMTGLLRRIAEPPAFGEALLDQGRVMMAAAIVPHWPGRVEVWSTISRFADYRHRAVAWRRCQAALDAAAQTAEARRMEMTVRADAPWRDTFAHLLGFQLEGVMRAWHPNGSDYCLYARINTAGKDA
jgi:hypothetical protein